MLKTAKLQPETKQLPLIKSPLSPPKYAPAYPKSLRHASTKPVTDSLLTIPTKTTNLKPAYDFCYIDEAGNRVSSKEKALIDLSMFAQGNSTCLSSKQNFQLRV